MAFSSAAVALLAVTLLVPAVLVEGYPTGAPPSPRICSAMYPGHKMNHKNSSLPDSYYSPQNLTTAPYTITAELQSNGKVKVSLRTSEYWEGFFLQARLRGTAEPVGIWEGLPDNSQTRDCLNGTKNAVTHNSKVKKTALDFTWTPPVAPVSMTVVFRGTFVKEFDVYWLGLESDALPVNAYISAGVPVRAMATVLTGIALLTTIVLTMF